MIVALALIALVVSTFAVLGMIFVIKDAHDNGQQAGEGTRRAGDVEVRGD